MAKIVTEHDILEQENKLYKAIKESKLDSAKTYQTKLSDSMITKSKTFHILNKP